MGMSWKTASECFGSPQNMRRVSRHARKNFFAQDMFLFCLAILRNICCEPFINSNALSRVAPSPRKLDYTQANEASQANRNLGWRIRDTFVTKHRHNCHGLIQLTNCNRKQKSCTLHKSALVIPATTQSSKALDRWISHRQIGANSLIRSTWAE